MDAMSAGNEGGLAARVHKLRADQPALLAAVAATRAGLLLAADAPEGADTETLAALGADLLVEADAAARALTGGEPREATVRGPGGHVIALAAGENAVLVALTDSLTPSSSVLPDLREAAQEIAERL